MKKAFLWERALRSRMNSVINLSDFRSHWIRGFVFHPILLLILLGAMAEFLGLNDKVFSQNWYRGNLHMHSYWSDGKAFPEEATRLYRDAGYNFVCQSDHNIFQSDAAKYFDQAKIQPAILERFQKRFPEFKLETERQNDKDVVRLLTFDEFQKKVEVPGQFILIPGYEHTGKDTQDHQVHFCAVNVKQTTPFLYKESVSTTIQDNMTVMQNDLFKGRESETLATLNHPEFIYYDIDPQDVLAVKDVRFFELLNWVPAKTHPNAWDRESFWDTVNSFRAERGEEFLLGTASDDSHGYDPLYDPTIPSVGPGVAGGGWIMVRANELTPESIIKAMWNSDFYTSTGVTLADVQFNRESKTLSVKVQPEEGVHYTISFLGTKKGFDHSYAKVLDNTTPNVRTFTTYSDEIGKTYQTVQGTEASFTMTDDFLYIRAKIVADKKVPCAHAGKPENPTAWTQPYPAK